MKKITVLIMVIVLIFVASGCKKETAKEKIGNTDNAVSQENEISANIPEKNGDKADDYVPEDEYSNVSYKELVKSKLNIPNGYKVPVYNGKLIAGETPDSGTFKTDWSMAYNDSNKVASSENVDDNNNYDSVSIIYKDSSVSTTLYNTLEEYKGQDVWFRVLIEMRDPCAYSDDEFYLIENEEYSFAQQKALEFLTAAGAHDIKTKVNTSEGNNVQFLEASLTANMIDMLRIGCFKMYLGQYSRNPEHSSVISDTLSIKLDKMSETDTLIIVAVTVYDRYNNYATVQNLTVNKEYNSERFKAFEEGIGVLLREGFELLEQRVENIMLRNNILKKRVTTSVKLGGPGTGTDKGTIIGTEKYYTNVKAGFNAVLTKAEILKLANDPEIKAIYATKYRTVYEIIE